MNTMKSLQHQWDAEARTIEAGKRAFHVERPEGEPSMLTGATFTIAMLALLVVGFQVAEWALT